MENLLSDKMKTFNVERDFTVSIPEGSITEADGMYKFIYYRVITRDQIYRINEQEFEAKLKAIKDGAKFIRLGNDVVNINEIKVFSKKFAAKNIV